MKRLPAILLCLAVGILIAGAGLWQVHRERQPITILTELPEGEFVREVELNRGKLVFKTAEEGFEQMLAMDFDDSLRVPIWGYPGVKMLPLTEKQDVTEEELMAVMNVRPELWAIGDEWVLTSPNVFWRDRCYLEGENGQLAWRTRAAFSFYYQPVDYSSGNRKWIQIKIAPAPESPQYPNLILQQNEPLTFGPTGGDTYGELDSCIGDAEMAVMGTNAVFILGNSAYDVRCNGLSQREFVELLISICETPQECTLNVMDYILMEKEEEDRYYRREAS